MNSLLSSQGPITRESASSAVRSTEMPNDPDPAPVAPTLSFIGCSPRTAVHRSGGADPVPVGLHPVHEPLQLDLHRDGPSRTRRGPAGHGHAGLEEGDRLLTEGGVC